MLESPDGAAAGRPSAAAGVRRIVVPLDGTPYGERALPCAVALARAFGAEIILVRADPLDTASSRGAAVPPRLRAREHAHAASLYLARLEQGLRRGGVRVSSRVPGGIPGGAVVAAARECAADLIVIATHAGSMFSRPSQVSVACEVARAADIPVLLLGSAGRGAIVPAGVAVLRLLLPLTGTPGDAEERALLQHAARLGQTFPSQLLVLRSAGDSGPSASGVTGGPGTAGEWASVDNVVDGLEKLRTRQLRAGQAAWTGLVYGDVIEETIRQAQGTADLILLGLPASPEGRQRTVDAAFRLVRQTALPVMLVPWAARPRDMTTIEKATSDEAEVAR